VGAVLSNDHFVYTSGKHGSVYVNKDALYPHPNQSSEVGELFAQKYRDHKVQVIVAPALGGIVLSQWAAYHLTKMTGRKALGIYTEKGPEKRQTLTRGYDQLVRDKRVLVVEDVLTTGQSVKYAVEAVTKAGGYVLAVCAMINRDPDHVTSETVGAPLSSLGILKAEAFDPESCPYCTLGISVNTSIGHGRQFLEQQLKK